MRHFIITILLLSAIGCSKSEKAKCYECKQVIDKKNGPVLVGASNSTTTYCDKSESDIQAFEQENNYVRVENGVTTSSTCNCKPK